MKRKKFYLAILCILLTCSAFATRTSFDELTNNWLQGNGTPSADSAPPGEPGGNGWDDGNAPIGDAFLPLLCFGFIYAAFVAFRSKGSAASDR